MNKYIGTKIIHAEPGPAPEQSGVYPKGSPGYTVKYEDGYLSWSPKIVFEAAYRRIHGLSFSMALEALKIGKAVRLPYWSPEVVIRMHNPDSKGWMTAPYLYVDSRYGRVPWKETFIELFSDEWQIVLGGKGE